MKDAFKLTIETEEIVATVQLNHFDVTTNEALDAFIGAMVSLGFSKESIDSTIKEY